MCGVIAATAPPNPTPAPPSYTSSIHAQVGGLPPRSVGAMPNRTGGNVHIKLRNDRGNTGVHMICN